MTARKTLNVLPDVARNVLKVLDNEIAGIAEPWAIEDAISGFANALVETRHNVNLLNVSWVARTAKPGETRDQARALMTERNDEADRLEDLFDADPSLLRTELEQAAEHLAQAA